VLQFLHQMFNGAITLQSSGVKSTILIVTKFFINKTFEKYQMQMTSVMTSPGKDRRISK